MRAVPGADRACLRALSDPRVIERWLMEARWLRGKGGAPP